MRKYIRQMMRYDAQCKGIKASKYVKEQFEKRQIKKYGPYIRDLAKAISTHPRRTWKNRCSGVYMQNEKAGT